MEDEKQREAQATLGGHPYIVGIVDVECYRYSERNCCWKNSLSEILGRNQSLEVWELLQLGHTQSIGSALFLGLADMAQTEWEWLMTDSHHVAANR